MLKIAAERTFTRDVTALAPTDGGHVEEPFKVTFRVLGGKEVEKFNEASVISMTDFLKRAVVKLDDLADADGKPVPYSDAVRDQALDLPHVRIALIRSYFAAVGKAKEGN